MASVSTSAASDALTSLQSKFNGASILSVTQFNRDDLLALMTVASYFADVVTHRHATDIARGRILAALFYEPSTRTSTSFQAAMLRLGGSVIPLTDVSVTSVSKGESLEDTIRCLNAYCDVIVMRHPVVGSLKRAAAVSAVPIINAGDGIGEHPTQALLDLYTIRAERQAAVGADDVDGLHVTMSGDLLNGRTVHSLALLLAHFAVTLSYVSAPELSMPQHVIDAVKAPQSAHTRFDDDIIGRTDILYVTRVQKERFADVGTYERCAAQLTISSDLLRRHSAKASLRILHPLPKLTEIATELDHDPRAAYYRQMRYGLFVRMALLAMVMGLKL